MNDATKISETNDNEDQQAPRKPPQRQPRLLRPNLRRQVIVTGETSTSVPIARPIELASVLQANQRNAALIPPKRPSHLPAKYLHQAAAAAAAAAAANQGSAQSASKPNRYAWAQWQAAVGQPGQFNPMASQHGPLAGKPLVNSHDLNLNLNSAGRDNHRADDGQAGFQHHFSTAASRVLIVNPMHIVNLSEHTKSRLIKSIEGIKKFSEKWFSHVLLLMFLAIYACFGAYIFISFEAPTEQWEKQLIIDTRFKIVNESWFEAKSKNQLEFVELFRSKFEDYERLLNKACNSGMNSNSLENQWTFWGALFYSMTVFTTIGYGHLTPITFAGRVATMIYAIFGIPILLMVLADLGKLLTRIIKFSFIKFRYLYNKLFKKNKTSIRTQKLIKDNTSQYLGLAKDALNKGLTLTRIPTAYDRVSRFREKIWHSKPPDPIQEDDEAEENGSSGGQQADEDPGQGQNRARLSEPRMSSDVIVTPNKQTKPVSPQVGDRKSIADPVATSGEHQNNNSNQHHSQNQHHVNSKLQQHNHHSASNHNHHNQNHNQHHSHSHQGSSFQNQNHSHEGKSKSLDKRQRKTSAPNSPSLGKSNPNSSVQTRTNNPKSSLSKSSSSSSSVLATSAAAQKSANQNYDAAEPAASAERTPSEQVIDMTVAAGGPRELQQQVRQKHQHGIDYEEEEEDDEQELYGDEELEFEEEDFDIPVSFALFLLVTYMMFGAVIFSIWEGWNFFDSLYFVFISMSTIGFGDLVPQHPKRMIGTFIYLLFGLALTSMCINVVQEKIHATFLRAKMQIGEKMGFDLDQIMADDYYNHGDGGSLMIEGDHEDDDDDCAAELSSVVAVSQANSLINHEPGARGDQEASEPESSAHKISGALSVDGDQSNQNQSGPSAAQGVRLSKSKESLKARKRNVTSLPGHNSGSLRRKASKRQTNARQSTPISTSGATAGARSNQPQHQPPTPAPSPPEQGETQQPLLPIKAELVTSRPQQAGDFSDELAPRINHPSEEVKSFSCEPLRRENLVQSTNLGAAKQANGQPKQQTSPSTVVKSRSSESNSINNRGIFINSAATMASTFRLNQQTKSLTKSANSSRRSSLSHELNQLDDLIMVLKSQASQDQSRRFGAAPKSPNSIPVRASSIRAKSPLTTSASNGPACSFNFSSRRATSMTSRSPTSQSPSSGALVKKRSLVSPASPSYLAAKANLDNLDLSESQRALAELEALKFSSAV